MSAHDLSVGAFGDEVSNLHDRLRSCGYEPPASEVERAFFGPGTREALQKWQRENNLTATGALDVASRAALGIGTAGDLRSEGITSPGRAASTAGVTATAGAINRAVTDAVMTYTVSGRVFSAQRAGVGRLRVQVVDRRVGGDMALAEARTDRVGGYSIDYPLDLVRRAGKRVPDIQVRVYSGDTFLAGSEVRYDATATEILDVVLPDTASAALPTEYEALTTAIRSHYDGHLRDLQETEEQPDLTYVANKTGWDARAVALAALADQFAANVVQGEIPSVFFYALFRAGIPATDTAVYQVDGRAAEVIWRQATEQGVIPAEAAAQIPAVVERFQRLSADKLLTGPPVAGVSSLKDLLIASGVPKTSQPRFAALYTEHRTDLRGFWQAVATEFGETAAQRLQIDGKLGFLTLNNAPLITKLRTTLANDRGGDQVHDLVELAHAGYYRSERWADLLDDGIAVPAHIPGETPKAQRANYTEYLAAQVRLSYPTACIAGMVGSGELAVGVPDQVQAFLAQHLGRFELGMQPVEQYLARHEVDASPEVVGGIKRLQRVYQVTSGDQAMGGLLRRGVDSAYQITRYTKQTFRELFAQDLGGEGEADRTHDRAVQVHNTVLNLAISYLTARGGISLGASPLEPAVGNGLGQFLQPAPAVAANAGDVIAYATLEQLFGEMDFCACEHCHSVLSPAAYLVDLLSFIDQVPTKFDKSNPQDVLFQRRPDLQHLPLTCENTNTALPYIDVVNETLEYFIANDIQRLSLKNFMGHDTKGVESADLLASPQFVMDAAYTILRSEQFPLMLPFHQRLESVRRYFDAFEVPLELAMERLRPGDDFGRGTRPYGWCDILMESLGLSRPEYEILTDSGTVPLRRAYGFPDNTTDNAVIAGLSNAREFARRLQITYEDLIALLQTRFVNPNVNLIPKLQRLGVPFATLKALKDNKSGEAFDALLPTGGNAPDSAEYGGDIKKWVCNQANYDKIMGLITLVDPTGKAAECSFDALELRHAQPLTGPADTSTRLTVAEYTRLLRLIRLWRRTGWTITQTDAAVCALFRTDFKDITGLDVDTVLELDAGLRVLLPRLGVVVRVLQALNLTPQRDLLPLLACWAPIGTHGPASLYRQLFLDPALLKQDPVFADNGYGTFLADSNARLADHAEAVRAACQLTSDEYNQIVKALKYDATTQLSIPTVSAVFRRGYLARKLSISVRELLVLTSPLTGLDPFAAPDPTDPAILRLITLVQALRDRSLPSTAALYLIWDQDLSGRSAPDPARIMELSRALRGDFAAIDEQFAASEDPGGDIARTKMTLVYGDEITTAFFALLDDTIVIEVGYTHPQKTLDQVKNYPRLVYDDFRHRLSHTGLLTTATAAALKALDGMPATFAEAVDALLIRGEDSRGSFFARHPELHPLYDAYVTATAPKADKRAALLASFQPELSRRRKRQQAIQRLSSDAGIEPAFPQRILNPPGPPYPLHAAGHPDRPGLEDVLGVETPGLAVQFFFRDTTTGPVDQSGITIMLDYTDGSANPLPANSASGGAVSGVWRGHLETPETGFYNIIVEADTDATVTLALDGQDCPLTRNGTVRRNTNLLDLQGSRLYELTLTVEKVRHTLSLKWETPQRPREVIPGRYLYPQGITTPFTDVYLRFLKAASLATALRLTVHELTHFATAAEYAIDDHGWLNALPLTGNPSAATATALLTRLRALLEYTRIKSEISPDDEALLSVLKDPVAAAGPTGTLLALTRWNSQDLNDILTHFSPPRTDLTNLEQFSRVYDALALVQKTGIAATALIAATTNDPTANIVRNLEGALRARYDAAGWRAVAQPINDTLRVAQRDALVAYILHQMASDITTAHIDTADKLFEYFLMDVEMDPCMQTSRIRHALSSAQLFIERCLMNLEPRVSSSSINTQQWEWMKRYRMWEANRKVFLYPENWLEPELRDDKSPFFKEIENELLQGDVTEESATAALINYVTKLEEVAKLEPCGLYYVEPDPQTRRGETTHLIARTAGARRTYYYRRQEYGYWTPWEQIKLDIKDNPVVPYVWNGRLLLFWLRIIQQSPIDPNQLPTTSSTTGPVAELSMASIREDAKLSMQESGQIQVQAVLCWSEYYNGKWQAAKTSDPERPTTLGFIPATGEVVLNLSTRDFMVGEVKGILLAHFGRNKKYRPLFSLYNTHSLPVRREDDTPHPRPPSPQIRRTRFGDLQQELFFSYYNSGANVALDRQVFRADLPFSALFPQFYLSDSWRAPFMVADRRRLFYVTTEITSALTRDYIDFGITAEPAIEREATIQPLILQKDTWSDSRSKRWGNAESIEWNGGASPLMRQFSSEDADAYIDHDLVTPRSIFYAGQRIGPAGAIPMTRFERQ